jgi:glycerol-3-phosphate dehydrogenase
LIGFLIMQRAVDEMAIRSYDMVVIGGGIYGACIARDAVLRGLSVALIERGDFGQATSHNSLKLIHGGLRYLQHLDLRRVRGCIRERNYWLKNAPHLIRPLDVLIPTYGHGTRGRAALWAATRLYNTLALDRNRGLAAGHTIPAAGLVSRTECQRRIPNLDTTHITGACVWSDGQMQNAARVVLECVQDAVASRTDAANYLQATGLVTQGSRVQGVRVNDLLNDQEFTIQARLVVNAGGPWLAQVLGGALKSRYQAELPQTRALNIVTKPLPTSGAVGVASHRCSDAVVGRSKRLYFITPWRGLSLIGTTHFPFAESPDAFRITATEVAAFIAEVNQAYPAANLTWADVIYCYGGLTPATGQSGSEAQRARNNRIIDHAHADGIEGLLSVSGVKFTSARQVAEQTVDQAARKLGRTRRRCMTRDAPLPGARGYPGRAALHERIGRQLGHHANETMVACLAEYGMRYPQVLDLWDGYANEQSILAARCRYAVRNEMARSLADVVLRRTAIAERGLLTASTLQTCADEMARELHWTAHETARQKQAVHARLAQSIPGHSGGDEPSAAAPHDESLRA